MKATKKVATNADMMGFVADLSKPVGQYDLNGNLIKIWPSRHEAKRSGFDDASISYHLKNGKPYKGYFWKQM